MNREEIMQIIPHRDSMLLIDEASVTDAQSAEGYYKVRGDEWFLDGHFPGNKVVPGVILCEIMAQTCSVILAGSIEGKTPYFTGMNNVKFKEKVKPGDLLHLKASLVKNRGAFYFAQGAGYVGDKLCVSAEFSFFVD